MDGMHTFPTETPSRKPARVQLVSPTPDSKMSDVLQSVRASPYLSSWADMWLGGNGPDRENDGGIANRTLEGGIANRAENETLEGGIANRVYDLSCNPSMVASDPSADTGGIAQEVQ
eukprot:6370194-Karenia_brevis.AAC.1